MKFNAACFIIFILCTLCLEAQENAKTGQSIGLTASLQSSQMDIMLPIFLNDRFAFAPALGFTSLDGFTDLGVGAVGRLYFERNTVSPFFSARFGLLFAIPKEGDSITDIITGIGGGGEYFISKNFSFGVEAQLNFTFSDKLSSRFGNPGGTNINTATAFFASVYF